MERFPNAFGHGILLPLLELLSLRNPPRGPLVWMVKLETELREPPRLHFVHAHHSAVFTFGRVGSLGVFTRAWIEKNGEARLL